MAFEKTSILLTRELVEACPLGGRICSHNAEERVQGGGLRPFFFTVHQEGQGVYGQVRPH